VGTRARVAERRWGIEDELVIAGAEEEAIDSEGVAQSEAQEIEAPAEGEEEGEEAAEAEAGEAESPREESGDSEPEAEAEGSKEPS
jgi:hypothetical protein